MLKNLDPDGIVKSISLLASEAKRLMIAHDRALTSDDHQFSWEADAAGYCLYACQRIAASAEAMSMVGVSRAAERLKGWLLLVQDKEGQISRADLRMIADGMNALIVSYGDELDGRRMFVMTPQYAKYFDYPEPLFGIEVFDAFPEAIGDIADAGKCLALGCTTACVMHLMRVLEVGLKAVANEFGITDKNDWGTYIREIESELKQRERAAGRRTADEQFYADACFQFGNLKVAYRNPTMHVANDYSDERAEEILVATRAFMRHLSPRFAA